MAKSKRKPAFDAEKARNSIVTIQAEGKQPQCGVLLKNGRVVTERGSLPDTSAAYQDITLKMSSPQVELTEVMVAAELVDVVTGLAVLGPPKDEIDALVYMRFFLWDDTDGGGSEVTEDAFPIRSGGINVLIYSPDSGEFDSCFVVSETDFGCSVMHATYRLLEGKLPMGILTGTPLFMPDGTVAGIVHSDKPTSETELNVIPAIAFPRALRKYPGLFAKRKK